MTNDLLEKTQPIPNPFETPASPGPARRRGARPARRSRRPVWIAIGAMVLALGGGAWALWPSVPDPAASGAPGVDDDPELADSQRRLAELEEAAAGLPDGFEPEEMHALFARFDAALAEEPFPGFRKRLQAALDSVEERVIRDVGARAEKALAGARPLAESGDLVGARAALAAFPAGLQTFDALGTAPIPSAQELVRLEADLVARLAADSTPPQTAPVSSPQGVASAPSAQDPVPRQAHAAGSSGVPKGPTGPNGPNGRSDRHDPDDPGEGMATAEPGTPVDLDIDGVIAPALGRRDIAWAKSHLREVYAGLRRDDRTGPFLAERVEGIVVSSYLEAPVSESREVAIAALRRLLDDAPSGEPRTVEALSAALVVALLEDVFGRAERGLLRSVGDPAIRRGCVHGSLARPRDPRIEPATTREEARLFGATVDGRWLAISPRGKVTLGSGDVLHLAHHGGDPLRAEMRPLQEAALAAADGRTFRMRTLLSSPARRPLWAARLVRLLERLPHAR